MKNFSLKKTAISGVIASASLIAINTPANAALLDLPALEYPLITFDNTGVTTFDTLTGLLSTEALPIALTLSETIRPTFIKPTSLGESVSINVIVDSNGNLIGGVEGDDLIIVGNADVDRDGIAEYSGVLLTAEVLKFGYQDDGANDLYNYTFAVTGGELASEFHSGSFGINVISEGSTFLGFTLPFTGGSKGTIGSIPAIPPAGTSCKIDVLGTCTVQTPPVEPACDAKIAASTFKYTGPTLYDATVEFIGKHGGYASYTTDLISGETILTSEDEYGYTVAGLDDSKGDLGAKMNVYINGQGEEIHTSCSVPFVVGQPAPINNGD
ncbi:MAG: hypothetical protein U9N57_03790, partial [Pseudomonadota bacterium]|nr:hypothetical protein [Pseudomonadota bacterium]